jgi:hypothetical protein
MKRSYLIALLFFFVSLASTAEEDNKQFSLGLHGFESLLGNYGLTMSFRLANRVELTIPLEFYNFSYSIPGSIAMSLARNLAPTNYSNRIPELSMFHLRAGLGARFFISRSALKSGLYFQPIVYLGWIKSSDFSNIEFDNYRESLDAAVNTFYRKLPLTNHFALSPQLNIGYQWISDSGFLFQLAVFGNYVYSPGLDSIFNAANRLFASDVLSRANLGSAPKTGVEMFRAFGTQMAGWHAGLSLNLGFAI